MSIYFNQQLPGQLWLRDLNDNVSPAYNILSSVYIKYKTINSSFFSDLTSNNINKFDVIYDTLFIETNNGYIFEKFYVDYNSQIQPYSQMNLFNTRKNTTVDYWYSESNKIIYFTELFFTQNSVINKTFSFGLLLKSFDCITGVASTVLLKKINLTSINQNLSGSSFIFENPKLTFNPDTKTFNISVILRNSAKDFGLLSLNIINISNPQISEINGFLPFFVLDPINSTVTDWS